MTDMSIQKLVTRGLTPEYAKAYEQFGYEFEALGNDSSIYGILNKKLRMYAADQSTDIKDITEILKKTRECLPAIKKICYKPKSHLKSINEIRPIDTVKRVGYESIPYLASHSEDWLARTATGLKPARLFSRVEEEDFQIYENRVVKTLIDKVINYLKSNIEDLENKYHQIRGILSSDTQTWSFGFDKGFQIAVKKLLPDNFSSGEKQVQLELAERLLKESKELKKKFNDLKQSRLYKLLNRIKAVTNPLNETNILLLDRQYKKVFLLWKEIQRKHELEKNEKLQPQTSDVEKPYKDYCYTLIQFALDTLDFKQDNDRFERKNDCLCANIDEENSGFRLQLSDIKKRDLSIKQSLCVPLKDGEKDGKFNYCNNILYWENDTTEKEIEQFCKKLITESNRQGRNNVQQRQYYDLKQAIKEINSKTEKIKEKYLYIYPLCCEIEDDELFRFKNCVQEYLASKKDDAKSINVIALPKILHNEQNLTNYAVNHGENIAFLPLTLFDINSYRRIQKMILWLITEFGIEKCPYCGNETSEIKNGCKCNKCELIITKTKCKNVKCKNEYKYLWYLPKSEELEKMREISDDDFFNKDSLFQYKDIVDMKINEQFRQIPICPKCGNK